MAMYLCGGASRIVLRMNVEQEITLEGQDFIKQQLEELPMTDGELIHWASMDDCYDLASLLISFGYKGPEHKEDADFILHGANYDGFYPEWLQIIDVHIKEKSKSWEKSKNFMNKIIAVKLKESNVNTVYDLDRNFYNLDTDVTWATRPRRPNRLPSNINAGLLKKLKDLDGYPENSKGSESGKSRTQLWLAENSILRPQEARKRLEKYLKRLHENGIFRDCLVVLIICFFVFIIGYWAIFGGDCRHHGPFLACGEQ